MAVQQRKKSKTKSEKGGKVNFLHAGWLSAFGCAVRFTALQVYVSEFLQKRTFSQSLYPVCSYIFSITRSQRRQLASSHNVI